ncbi:flagellar FliJ family protein [Geodermatophilus sabuli]|uniref:Flagellar export protein FliJ n=1 Tax=Geodermatophilus sabuli TaxID=1564158 RepID=A0A285EGM5_9ACTN|nr:flagellar FliJ family protein [Geodermatophilus sabuli]MBB3083154.1 flagellar export protein FliJ [Geodermatophilus sabuli]SNX98150.1 flagellar export protein FliJ [Geodermatophilus sabuli]
MKRGRFRLQPVLEVRRVEERAAALAAAEAARAAADADRRAAEAERAVAATVPTGAVSSGVFRAGMVLARVAAEDAAAARALATASAEQAELVRAAWTAAAQRTKGLERLRERHLQAVRLAEQAAEERTVDDLVTGRSGRRTPAGEVPWTG